MVSGSRRRDQNGLRAARTSHSSLGPNPPIQGEHERHRKRPPPRARRGRERNALNRFYAASLRQVAIVVFTALAALAFAAAVGPALLGAVETAARYPLSFEWALRGYVLIALAVWLWGFTAHALAQPRPAVTVAWTWLIVVGLAVAVVCVLDRRHPLDTEFSWIRYTTGACLIALGALAIPIARGHSGGPAERPFRLAWIVVGAGAVFLALDEMLEIHEIVGDNFRKMVGLPHAFIDWITLGYGLVGLALALWIGPRVLRSYGRDHPAVLRLFAVGAVLYLSGQVLDSTDRFFHPWLSGLAAELSADPRRVFSDVWYFFWQPRVTFNTIEEVLENLAAALFAAAAMLLLIERNASRLPAIALPPRPRMAAVAWGVLIVACGGLLLWARPTLWVESPVPGLEARRVIGPEHGLLHADAGAYAPEWGALVANEGVGDVLGYRDGTVRTFPNPAEIGAELDAVAADRTAVYASLPGRHAIVRYTEDGGWTEVAGAADGLDAPEGLTVVDSTIYAVDETSHRLYTVSMPSRRVSVTPLEDPRCRFPEAIAWHRGLDALLVTDDKSGFVVALAPGGAMRTFASRVEGLRSPEDLALGADGNIYVSDPARREVIEFSPDGRILGRLRFTRVYGDVVGVDVVGAGARRVLYVVTADARHNDAFVPSSLWEIPLGESSPLP